MSLLQAKASNSPSSDKGRNSYALQIFVLTFALWLYLWATQLRKLSYPEICWTTVLFWLCALPTLLFVIEKGTQIPLMPLWGLFYFATFGMPMTSKEQQELLGFIPLSLSLSALRMVTLGAAMCLLSFYTPLGRWVEQFTPRIRAPWNPTRAVRIGVFLSLFGVSIRYWMTADPNISPGLRQPMYLLSQTAPIGTLTLFLLYLRRRLTVKLKILLWGVLVPVQYLIGLGTGLLYNAMLPLAPLFVCYAAEKRRFPLLPAALTILVLLVPFSIFKGEFRATYWHGREDTVVDENISPIQKGLLYIDLVFRKLPSGGKELYESSSEATASRINQMQVLLQVLDLTPAYVPFWNGQTYLTLLWAPVPRFLFPDKPSLTVGQDFGHRYEFLDEWDESTSVNLPHQVVEMYANFGWLGVTIGMAIIGLFYRILSGMLSHSDVGERGIILGSVLCILALSVELNFSAMVVGVMYLLGILLILTKLMGDPKPQNQDMEPVRPAAS